MCWSALDRSVTVLECPGLCTALVYREAVLECGVRVLGVGCVQYRVGNS